MKNQRVTLCIISLLLFAGFVFFSYLVARETFVQIDFDTTVKLQDRIPRVVDYPFSLLSVLGSVEVTGVISFLLLLYFTLKRFFLTALSLFLLPLALLIEVFGKLFVYHPGPPRLFFRGLIELDLPSHYVPVDYAYPSGHMMRTTFLICFLITYLYLRHSIHKWLIPSIVFSFILIAMFISRIYLGEHWFTDVIGGLLLGSSFGILAGITAPKQKSTVAKHEALT